jgi:hypothetical protein
MASKDKYTKRGYPQLETVPFDSAQEAWFWFIQAQEAKNTGARIKAGQGMMPRPCEPLDILQVLDRLYRNRRLLREHLLVLRHYGRRMLAPDPRRIKEARAHSIWHKAFECIEPVLVRKGIVRKSGFFPNENWHLDAYVLEGAAAK